MVKVSSLGNWVMMLLIQTGNSGEKKMNLDEERNAELSFGYVELNVLVYNQGRTVI